MLPYGVVYSRRSAVCQADLPDGRALPADEKPPEDFPLQYRTEHCGVIRAIKRRRKRTIESKRSEEALLIVKPDGAAAESLPAAALSIRESTPPASGPKRYQDKALIYLIRPKANLGCP